MRIAARVEGDVGDAVPVVLLEVHAPAVADPTVDGDRLLVIRADPAGVILLEHVDVVAAPPVPAPHPVVDDGGVEHAPDEQPDLGPRRRLALEDRAQAVLASLGRLGQRQVLGAPQLGVGPAHPGGDRDLVGGVVEVVGHPVPGRLAVHEQLHVVAAPRRGPVHAAREPVVDDQAVDVPLGRGREGHAELHCIGRVLGAHAPCSCRRRSAVAASTRPVTSRPWSRWKRSTAIRVKRPSSPSVRPTK